MRKFSLVAMVMILAAPALVPAQGISFGLKGGLNVANMSSDSLSGTEGLAGVAIGGYVSLGLLPNIAVQPEILFSQKGCKESGDLGGVPWEATTRINYLEIPVLAKISLGAIVKPYVLAGPYFSTMMGATGEATLGGISGSLDISDLFKSSDFGLTFGAGVQTPIKLSVEARYSVGLSSIDKYEPDENLKNQNISLLIGYSIF